MTLHGHVENGVVVLEKGTALPDGTLVQVIPMANNAGNSAAAGTRRPKTDPFAEAMASRDSKERRDALLSLIGICKSEHPPSDEEMERIVDEARMKKYA